MTHTIFLISLLLSNPKLNRKIPFYFFSFSILFLFLALRYNFGNDYISYSNIHDQINNGLYSWGSEDFLFKNLNLLIPNFECFIAFISFFYILCIYYLIKKNLKIKEYWLSIAFLLFNPYLFLIHLSSLRQTIAICFVIIGVNCINKNKRIMYILSIIVASGFHKSAIVLIPIVFLLNEKKLNKVKIISIISLLLLLLFTPLFDFIMNNIYNYLPNNYKYYVNQRLGNSIISVIMSTVLFIIIIININKLEGKEIILAKMSLISTIIAILTVKISMLSRIGMYFDIFLIITFTNILSKLDKKIYKYVLLSIILGIYLARYISFFNDPIWIEHYSKYTTILTK